MKSLLAVSVVAACFAVGCGSSPAGSTGGSPSTSVDGVLVDSVVDSSGKEDSASSSKPRLVLPLLELDNGKALAYLNPELKSKGMKTFPKYVAVTGDEAGRQTWLSWERYLEDEVNAALGTELAMESFGYPGAYEGEYNGQQLEICYRGDATKIVDVMRELGDVAFETQFTVLAWKYKSESWMTDDWNLEDEVMPDEWEQWGDGDGESVLLIWTGGDEGTDRNVHTLRRCYSK
jgi:hypothetical protein